MALDNPLLTELAQAYGIATEFWDWKGRLSQVPAETVIAVLKALDVDASSDESARAALDAHRLRPWTLMLPRCVVTIAGRPATVAVHVGGGQPVSVHVRLEDGGSRPLRQLQDDEPDRWVGDRWTGRATFEIPTDLPTGYHWLAAESSDASAETALIVTPAFLGFPEAMGARRAWGYATQLYSVRGQDSWGMGDLQDLADLATWSATQQFASYILVNPLHASEPMPPLEPSPYLPTSRRYVNPLYIRPEAIPEFARLDEFDRKAIRRLRRRLKAAVDDTDTIDRNAIWKAKIEALRIIYAKGLKPARRMSLDDFIRREGPVLSQFATWCVLAREFGMNWREWPEQFRRTRSPEVADFAGTHADEISFFIWLQWVADTQLSAAQATAKDAGMRIGIMNDLAVGVSGNSAEVWTLGDVFARGVSVGAPADHYNQLGQDWGQSPWRPDRLDDLAYGPFRQMVSGILRHSGGIRVDHILGLFRLWWIPEGNEAHEGTYVHYNHEAMVGILALEAQRAGALVVGEDLGTVEPGAREYLASRGLLGTSVAWFERGHDGRPLAPEAWREYCMASVTTHDMPPTAGYLAMEHVQLQHELGLLTEQLGTEIAFARAEQGQWLTLLRERGLLAADDTDVESIVLAMHRFLLATPSRVLVAALTDAVGERKTQNQPGTVNEYPNWRVPLHGSDGRRLWLEDVYDDARALRLAGVMNGFQQPPTLPRS
ncbi:MAG: 4-alpha-glucanotransferase [Micropruina sp.]|nr:4-alpha-glucanotransferase [Micropruina sp.]